jgi:TonB family protein
MIPVLTLWLTLLAPQTTTAATPTLAPPPSATPAQSTPAAPAKAPCSNPDAAGKFHIGCGVTPPVVIHSVEPKYPEEARAQKLSTGGVVVALVVDTNGNPTDVHVKNSKVDKVDKSARSVEQLLEDNMVDAVRQYKFKPATFQGKPVPIELNVEVNIDFF